MSSKSQYPYFNSLEVLLENDFVFRRFKTFTPVKAGNTVPDLAFSRDFGRWQQYINGIDSAELIPFVKFKSQPLVIAFYSQHWGQAGIDQLLRLNKLQNELKAVGGNLVVISPQKESLLAKLAWEHNLSLTFYFDLQNEIARNFRVFSEESPVWKLFTGVDENVPLLATYVVSHAKQVLYDHFDLDLSDAFLSTEIMTAVVGAALHPNTRKLA